MLPIEFALMVESLALVDSTRLSSFDPMDRTHGTPLCGAGGRTSIGLGVTLSIFLSMFRECETLPACSFGGALSSRLSR